MKQVLIFYNKSRNNVTPLPFVVNTPSVPPPLSPNNLHLIRAVCFPFLQECPHMFPHQQNCCSTYDNVKVFIIASTIIWKGYTLEGTIM